MFLLVLHQLVLGPDRNSWSGLSFCLLKILVNAQTLRVWVGVYLANSLISASFAGGRVIVRIAVRGGAFFSLGGI